MKISPRTKNQRSNKTAKQSANKNLSSNQTYEKTEIPKKNTYHWETGDTRNSAGTSHQQKQQTQKDKREGRDLLHRH